MNDERERQPRGEGDDPVADFFARERDSIRQEPADDLRWQRIVREAGSGRPSRWLATVGGVAAAGVVAASLAFGPQVLDTLQGPGTGLTPASQSPNAPSASALPSSGSPTNPAQTGSPQPSTVPGTFVAGSLSNAGQHRLYLLGTSECGTTRCPTLQTSADDGASWQVAHTFSAQDAGLDQVRFANPEVGWAYGSSSIKVTRDGGRTWTDYGFPGDTVLDLESNGEVVVVASSSRCASGTCSGQLQVSRAPIGGAKAAPVATGPSGVLGAEVETSDKRTLVVPEWSVKSKASGPWLLAGSRLAPLSRAAGCGGPAAGTVALGADDPSRMVAMCSGGSDGAFAVSSSDDAGTSWSVASSGDLLLKGEGPVSLAAASRSHLLAMRGDTLQVSSDAGQTWHTPAAPPPTPQQGWAWIGAPGGTQLYALAGDDSGYWVSSDWGEHWAHVAPLS